MSFLVKISVYSLGIIVLYSILRRIYVRFRHLSDIPGPKWAAYSRYWILKTLTSGDSARKFIRVNKEYGHLARIGPNHLLTNDPDITRGILAARSSYVRGPWFDSLRFDPHHTSIASERDPKKHDDLRCKVSAGYAIREFPGLEITMNDCLEKWMFQVDKEWISGDSKTVYLDLARSVRTLTLEITAHVCFSEGLGFSDSQQKVNSFWESIEKNAPYGQYLSVITELFRLVHVLTKLPGMKESLLLTETNNPGIGKIIGLARRITEERYSPNAKKQLDMLGSWMAHGLTKSESETEISIALVTGAFPVAAAINVILLHIITNRRVFDRLRQAIDNAVVDGTISTPIQYSEAKKLPFLQACIHEGLRKYPPIIQLRERVTPPGGDTIAGKSIPGGVFIGFNTGGTQLHECFGAEPDIFVPERWLIEDEERLSEMRRVAELVFGYGSTKCIGMPQAFMVLNKVLVEIVRNWDVTLVDPTRPWLDQCNGVSFHREFHVKIVRREDLKDSNQATERHE